MSDTFPPTCGLDAVLPSFETHRAVLALDSVGHIVAINQSYLSVTGYRRPELIGRPIWMLLDLAERCAGRLSVLLDLPPGAILHLPDLAHRSRTGRRFRVDARAYAIAGDGGGTGLRMVFARPEDQMGAIVDLTDFQHRRALSPGLDDAARLITRPEMADSARHLRIVKH